MKFLFQFIILNFISNSILTFTTYQINENEIIISLISNKNSEIYYFTETKCVEIKNDGSKNIILTNLNLTKYSQVTFINKEKEILISVCTKENLYEIFNIDGTIITKYKYDEIKITSKTIFTSCSVVSNEYMNVIGVYGKVNNEIPFRYIKLELDENYLKKNYEKISYTMDYTSETFDLNGPYIMHCILLNDYSCFHKNQNGFSVRRIIAKKSTTLKNDYSIYKIFNSEYNKDAIFYFLYGDEINVIYTTDSSNFKNNYFLKTIKNFDYNLFTGNEMGSLNQNKWLLFYKENDNDRLILEVSSLNDKTYESNGSLIIENINSIGYSNLYSLYLGSSNYFFMIKGSDSYNETLEYFYYDQNKGIDNNEDFCNVYNIKAYSYEIITLYLNDYLKYDINNDNIFIYPENLNTYVTIENNNKMIINTQMSYGNLIIKIGLKTLRNNYLITHYPENCRINIQICVEGCEKCERNDFSLNGNPGYCNSKMCLDGYYYDPNEDTNCFKLTSECYGNCNTCSSLGDEDNNNCLTCKRDIHLDSNNNCECLYFYYKNLDNNKIVCLETNSCTNENYPYFINGYYECYNECPINNKYHIKDNYECIQNCPSNLYIAEDEKLCVNSCSDSNLSFFYINNILECYIECPNDYKYHIIDNYECIQNCPSDYYTVEGEKLCVNSCSESKSNYYVNGILQCYEECPSNSGFHIINNYRCIESCPLNYYVIEEEKLCTKNCYESDFKYYINGILKCYIECPDDYKYHIKDNYECIQNCPSNYYVVEEEKLCVNSCLDSNYKYHIDESFNCLLSCPSNYFIIYDLNICVEECGKVNYESYNLTIPNSKFCYNQCPTNYPYHIKNKNECIQNCPSNFFIDEDEKLCLDTCLNSNINKFYIKGSMLCINKCPEDYEYYIKDTNECHESCPSNYYVKESEKLCVNSCLLTGLNYSIQGIMECYNECPDNYKYHKKNQYQCISSCPLNYYIIEDLNLCVNSCYEDINYNYPYYITNTFNCINECPNDYEYHIENNFECISSCPYNYYIIEDLNLCVLTCPLNYQYYIPYLHKCYNECPESNKYHIENSYECLIECPVGYYTIEEINLCVLSCNSDYPYYIKNEYYCYNKCPSKNKYHIEDNYECLIECPTNYNSLNNLDLCISYCHDSDRKYYINGINICYEQCPIGYDYKLNDSLNSFECYNKCPSNYYEVENSKLCVKKCQYFFSVINYTKCECIFNLIKESDYNLQCDINIDLISYINSLSSNKTNLTKSINKYLNFLKEYYPEIFTSLLMLNIVDSPQIDYDYNKNSNISSVILGECENILKNYYNLNKNYPLVILLIETKSPTNAIVNSIQIEIYDQNKNKLDLSLCSNTPITIYYALNEDKTVNVDLVNNLQNIGYDLFNISSDFYTERCLNYYVNGNDVVVKDRVDDIYQNVSICESNCSFKEYYIENNRSKCSCFNFYKEDNETYIKKEIHGFFENLNSQINYKLVKCYKIFNKLKYAYKNNMGFWIGFCSISIFIILEIIFLKYSKRLLMVQIYNDFQTNIKNKLSPPKRKETNYDSENNESEEYEKYEIDDKNYNNKTNNYYTSRSKNIKINNSKKIKKVKFLNQFDLNSKTPSIKSNSLIINENHKLINKKMVFRNDLKIKLDKSNFDNLNNDNKKKYQESTTEYQTSTNRNLNKDSEIYTYKAETTENSLRDDFIDIKKIKNVYFKYRIFFLHGKKHELNDMNYNEAIIYDARNFFKIYLSFLFSKIELISILFFPQEFNSYTITIQFYIFCLLFDFTLNAILYTDDIVSEKYYNNGKLSYLTSFLLSGIANFITAIFIRFFRKLIYYSSFLELLRFNKNEKSYLTNLNLILKTINRRLIIYFILEMIISLFCFYYLFIFCYVYKKSQISLLFNYLNGLFISIAISFLITFIFCLLRLIALKCKASKLYYSSRFLIELI